MRPAGPDHEGDAKADRSANSGSPSLAEILRTYIEVTKPASVLLLVFTGIAAMIVAAGGAALPPDLLVTTQAALT